MIHSVIFCPERAKARYSNPEEFSERSIVQLKNKFKKEQNKIYEIIENKKPTENVAWFEKKYKINIQAFQDSQKSIDSESSELEQFCNESVNSEISAGPMSIGLISNGGIGNYKSNKSTRSQ